MAVALVALTFLAAIGYGWIHQKELRRRATKSGSVEQGRTNGKTEFGEKE
jgi:hypothetical protein